MDFVQGGFFVVSVLKTGAKKEADLSNHDKSASFFISATKAWTWPGQPLQSAFPDPSGWLCG
jgi:hypothetical protein